MASQAVKWSDNLATIHGLPRTRSTARSRATSARSILTIATACSRHCSAAIAEGVPHDVE
jgi:hypothetical protein